MSAIEWRAVPGWEGFYEVSSDGLVRSLDRVVPNRIGVTMPRRGIELKAGTDDSGYPVVWLHRDGKRLERRVSTLVCEAWHGARPDGHEVRHLNDDKTDNTPSNLRWGTRSENTFDKVRNGLHPMASKTHCKSGHPFDLGNTYIAPDGGRRCRRCRQEAKKRNRAQRKATA